MFGGAKNRVNIASPMSPDLFYGYSNVALKGTFRALGNVWGEKRAKESAVSSACTTIGRGLIRIEFQL